MRGSSCQSQWRKSWKYACHWSIRLTPVFSTADLKAGGEIIPANLQNVSTAAKTRRSSWEGYAFTIKVVFGLTKWHCIGCIIKVCLAWIADATVFQNTARTEGEFIKNELYLMVALLPMLFLVIQYWNSGQLLINQYLFTCYEGCTCLSRKELNSYLCTNTRLYSYIHS